MPNIFPLNLLPKPSAESSITGMLYLLAISIMRVQLYGMPYSATGIMALGVLPVLAILSLMASSRRSGSIFHVSFSESMKTGVAPKYVIGWLEAQKVKLCTSTSSPRPTPQAIRARCIAAVPADRATTSCLPPWNSFRSASKAFTFGPNGTTQLVSNASCMYFCSRPCSLMCARQR